MLAVELAMGLFVELGFLQRHQLTLSQHPTILGDLRFQSLQPLLHRLQVVAHPNAAYAKRRHLGAALLQLVGGPRLAPGGLVDGHSHHHRLDLRRGAVLQIGLGACDLGQRKIPTLLIQIPEAIEAIARIAHHSAGLGHAAQLLSQLQQPDLSLDHLTLGGRHDGLPGETGRGGALRLWLRAPASSPTVSNRPSYHVKTSTLNRQKLRRVRRREGRYLLRTNLTENDPALLWQYYTQLVAVEQAFKDLKGDLAIRPFFHQD